MMIRFDQISRGGYRDLFEKNDHVGIFRINGKNLKVHLRLATEDAAIFAGKNFYRPKTTVTDRIKK